MLWFQCNTFQKKRKAHMKEPKFNTVSFRVKSGDGSWCLKGRSGHPLGITWLWHTQIYSSYGYTRFAQEWALQHSIMGWRVA